MHVGATKRGAPESSTSAAEFSDLTQLPRHTRSDRPPLTYKFVERRISYSASNSRENSPDIVPRISVNQTSSTPRAISPKLASKSLQKSTSISSPENTSSSSSLLSLRKSVKTPAASEPAAELVQPPQPPQPAKPRTPPPESPSPEPPADDEHNDTGNDPSLSMQDGVGGAAAAATISGDGALLPTPFEGKPSDDATAWLGYFVQYCDYKGIKGKPQQLQLFRLLMKNQAWEWYDALEQTEKDTYDNLEKSFKKRYEQSNLVKYRSAKDIFNRKQGNDESVDDYVTAMRQMAKKISEKPDEDMIRFAILAGLQPHIANLVVAKAPTNITELLEEARIAELTTPPYAADSPALQLLTAEVKRLSKQLERNATFAITSERRSPTPERRRVSFSSTHSPTPPPSGEPRGQYVNRGGRGFQNRGANGFQNRGGFVQRGVYHRGATSQDPPPGAQDPQICGRCGYQAHTREGERCPAMRDGQTCNYCSKFGHFSSQCRAAMRNRTAPRNQQNQ